MNRWMTAAAALLLASNVESADPPASEKIEVRATLHGVEIVDPYRWLEGSAAPELKGKSDPELDARVSAWTDAQNAHTRSVLDNLPGRKKLEEQLRPLMEMGSVSAPSVRRDLYFFSRRDGKDAQRVYYVQKGHAGTRRVLLDTNELDESGLTAPSFLAPNHDGTLAAFGLYRAGDENTTAYVLDVESGVWLADEIPGKVGGVQWTPDSKGFFYRRLADLKNPYSGEIRYHALGTHPRQDKLLFEQYKEGPHATTWGPYAWISRDARWMLLMYWTGAASNDLWVIDLDRWFATGEFVRTPILIGADATASGDVVGDTLYMMTTLDAPNGRVLAVDLRNPERARWKEILPERKDATLDSIAISRSYLIADYLKDVTTRLEIVEFDGTPLRAVELPGVGSAGIRVEQDRDEAFVSFTSFNEPYSVYRVDLRKGTRELWARPDIPVDPSKIEVKQVFYQSKDGTRVPMFVVHRKGLVLNGNNPTLLYGYGGFNSAMSPSFSATLFQWYEAGGVYAVANLRGGSEYGEAWHQAGMLERKQNTFDDFIAAAEWLIANRYTRPERLAIYGGSNGGLLTGAALVQRPDLFAAVISAVPLLDMLRYQDFLMARYWVPEYGSAENPEHFGFLRAYSPYHNIVPRTEYPAVLLTAGENDSRVHPLHARKMAAALQAATTSVPAKDPILLWVDRSSGHGQGKPLHLRVRDAADQRIFLMWQLGMLEGR
ncbi:MAG TPA: prolyl oligopeptidase family serine peptidase [Thermoanaerobaculia bacterium]|nr:prolyl oligopeptidase family serine peptidase [Thermoanaerobaculia bacterium]